MAQDFLIPLPQLLLCRDNNDYISLIETVEKVAKYNPNREIGLVVLAGPEDRFYRDPETEEPYDGTRWVQITANVGQQSLIMEINKKLEENKKKLAKLAKLGNESSSQNEVYPEPTHDPVSVEKLLRDMLNKPRES